MSAGHDQRVKLFFPLAGQTDPVVPEGEDWYPEYRAMPEDERPPMRTFTLRELRRDTCEMDVDFVLHGDTGPASSWAGRAEPGQRLAILAPTAVAAESSVATGLRRHLVRERGIDKARVYFSGYWLLGSAIE